MADTFRSSIEPIPPAVRSRMDGRSMRPGCPVGYDGLRYVHVTYRGFDGADHQGELVVNATVADDDTITLTGVLLDAGDTTMRRFASVGQAPDELGTLVAERLLSGTGT